MRTTSPAQRRVFCFSAPARDIAFRPRRFRPHRIRPCALGTHTGLRRPSPKAFSLRNTGQLPLTLTGVGLEGGNKQSFVITDNDCDTRTLQPEEGCTVEIAFIAPGVLLTARVAGLYALRSASDAAGDAERAGLRGWGVVTPGQRFREQT